MYNSVGFNIFTKLCSHHHSNFITFLSLPKEALYLLAVTPIPPLSSPWRFYFNQSLSQRGCYSAFIPLFPIKTWHLLRISKEQRPTWSNWEVVTDGYADPIWRGSCLQPQNGVWWKCSWVEYPFPSSDGWLGKINTCALSTRITEEAIPMQRWKTICTGNAWACREIMAKELVEGQVVQMQEWWCELTEEVGRIGTGQGCQNPHKKALKGKVFLAPT